MSIVMLVVLTKTMYEGGASWPVARGIKITAAGQACVK